MRWRSRHAPRHQAADRGRASPSQRDSPAWRGACQRGAALRLMREQTIDGCSRKRRCLIGRQCGGASPTGRTPCAATVPDGSSPPPQCGRPARSSFSGRSASSRRSPASARPPAARALRAPIPALQPLHIRHLRPVDNDCTSDDVRSLALRFPQDRDDQSVGETCLDAFCLVCRKRKNTGRSTTSSTHRSRPLAVAFRLAQD